MYTTEMCKERLIECLICMLFRKQSIDKNVYEDVELELAENKFGYSFIVFICGERFNINFFTTIKTAEYVYENIDNIEYIQIKGCKTDTLVGYIPDFIINEFSFEECSDGYFIAIQLYEQFIRKTDSTPNIENIVSYIKEKM